MLLSTGVYAQRDSLNWSVGIDFSAFFSGYGRQILTSPNINVSYRNHTVGGGPTFILLKRYPGSVISNAKFIGMYGYYRIYLMPETRILEIFPEYNFIYSRFTGNSDWSGDWSSKEFEHYIGYGSKIKFLRRMYINHSAGIGAVFSSRRNWPYYGDSPERTKHKKLTGILKVGIGYGF